MTLPPRIVNKAISKIRAIRLSSSIVNCMRHFQVRFLNRRNISILRLHAMTPFELWKRFWWISFRFISIGLLPKLNKDHCIHCLVYKTADYPEHLVC
jgi:hypothetical protein